MRAKDVSFVHITQSGATLKKNCAWLFFFRRFFHKDLITGGKVEIDAVGDVARPATKWW
jgi:hypothetical protein